MVSGIVQTRVGSRELSALKRKAERLGLTPQKYLKRLILEDLALDRKALSSSYDELAAPFRKAFRGMSESELDHIVEKARRPRSRKSQGRR